MPGGEWAGILPQRHDLIRLFRNGLLESEDDLKLLYFPIFSKFIIFSC